MCRVKRVGLGALVLLATACAKSDGGGVAGTASAVPSEAPTISITGTPPPAAPVASASATPSPVVAVAPTTASAPPSASANAGGAKASTTATSANAAPTSSAKPEAAPLKPAATSISGKNFTLAVASPGCRVDVPCAVTLRITAGGQFHVNKEYPYKFTANAAPGITFLGGGDANVFSRAAGDFREETEKSATMTVRFKPTAAGEARIAGTYKLSVCTADQCQVESQAIQLAIPTL